jgi:glycine/D-amino acid oxidase-like deaminating enzyme
MLQSTPSLWRPEPRPQTGLPESAQVVVIGAGIAGLAVAQRLISESVDVHVIEARPDVGGGMASRGMGIASVLLLDPPHRLVQAVGASAAKDILRFSAAGVAHWGDAMDPTGVVYATKGAAEAREIDQNLEAMAALGIMADSWSPEDSPGIGPGWIQPQGGTLNLESTLRALAHGVSVSTQRRVIAIDDDGFDLRARMETGESIKADVVIMTGGAQVTPWATDKFHPVRHQAIATAAVQTCIPRPMHIQYGYTSARQTKAGRVLLSGCRWATPHMEAGETDDSTVQPNVDARLRSFLHEHWPHLRDTPITHQWSSIMTFSCDGLPIIGPLPGRPRIISCGGFGAFSPSLALRAADAVVDGVLTGESPGVPACFETRRFS